MRLGGDRRTCSAFPRPTCAHLATRAINKVLGGGTTLAVALHMGLAACPSTAQSGRRRGCRRLRGRIARRGGGRAAGSTHVPRVSRSAGAKRTAVQISSFHWNGSAPAAAVLIRRACGGGGAGCRRRGSSSGRTVTVSSLAVLRNTGAESAPRLLQHIRRHCVRFALAFACPTAEGRIVGVALSRGGLCWRCGHVLPLARLSANSYATARLKGVEANAGFEMRSSLWERNGKAC